jgi:two-component system chemotaxis sensor kinase CheA
MNLIGELVLARNQVLQHKDDTPLATTAQRLNLITTELQEGVMKTRMQPIGNIWNKFPRLVRDLSVAHEKRVRLEMDGADTELDKTLIEAIKDPLIHLVRNAIDHGIERPEDREAAEKSVEGRVYLRAYHEGGQVNVEITDDGCGIDPERLKQLARERALVPPEQLARMGDREATQLIFLPGFSTAEQVTNTSGRGVGMDVVKTNIERIGGTVDVQSTVGRGTTIRVKIPLTLAIVPALIVESGEERYAIPQVSLQELVRLEGEDVKNRIESIRGVPVYRLRGRLLPLVSLRGELGREGADGASDAVSIVVLRADDCQFGLVVDAVDDTAEIVVKPLGKFLQGTKVFAGATIMGDGRVALILDVLGLAQRASLVSDLQEQVLATTDTAANVADEDRQTMLLFQTPDEGRMATPLSSVTRLEVFPRTQIERTGIQDVVQYRDGILPLVYLRDFLPERRAETRTPSGQDASDDAINVIVYSSGVRPFGLVVDRIVDIVEESVSLDSVASREGVLGSAVVGGRVTEFLDVAAVVRHSDETLSCQAA